MFRNYEPKMHFFGVSVYCDQMHSNNNSYQILFDVRCLIHFFELAKWFDSLVRNTCFFANLCPIPRFRHKSPQSTRVHYIYRYSCVYISQLPPPLTHYFLLKSHFYWTFRKLYAKHPLFSTFLLIAPFWLFLGRVRSKQSHFSVHYLFIYTIDKVTFVRVKNSENKSTKFWPYSGRLSEFCAHLPLICHSAIYLCAFFNVKFFLSK